MNIIEFAEAEKQRATAELKHKKSEIRQLSRGRLECHRRGNNWTWKIVSNGKKKYLAKRKHTRIAESLAYKRKLQSEIDYLENHISAINTFLEMDAPEQLNMSKDKRSRSNEEINRLAQAYYDRTHPEIVERKKANLIALEENIQKFKGKEINKSEYPVKSAWGLRFRSKSEALIYERLRAHDLLVLYEPDLEINGRMRSPDFIVYNKRTNESIVWEHFGRMKDPEYLYSNKRKILQYLDGGYIPNINMIMTFEADDNRVDFQYIESLIENFLL